MCESACLSVAAVLIIVLGIGCLLVDKGALNSASSLGFQTDLGLKGSEYSWSVSIYCES